MSVLTFMTMMILVLIMETDDDINDDTDDDTNDDTDGDADGGGRVNLYAIKVPSCCSWVPGPCGPCYLLLCGLAQKNVAYLKSYSVEIFPGQNIS